MLAKIFRLMNYELIWHLTVLKHKTLFCLLQKISVLFFRRFTRED